MWLVAATDVAGLVTLAIAVMGVAGVIFTALKFNRDDTTAIVGQQTTVLHDMKALNEELRATNAELKQQVAHLAGQVEALREQLARIAPRSR